MISTTSSHPDNAALQAFLDDEINGTTLRAIEDHLAVCDKCQRNVDRLSNAHAGPMSDTLRKIGCSTVSSQYHLASSTFGPSNEIRIDNGKRYLLHGEVARGGMGIIYRGYDPEINREIAIKIMNPALSTYPDDLIRFRREARLAGQLQHPGIVPIHELGCLSNGRMYIAMKLVDGITLRQLMDQGCSTIHQTSHLLDVFNQICQTIAYAHSRNVIHRDLKPENVMVGAFGEVQVMDWGLAKLVVQTEKSPDTDCNNLELHKSDVEPKRISDLTPLTASTTRVGSVVGTPAYMSPEQALGKSIDKRADVFALGAILTEILTGSAPYHEGSPTVRLGQAAASDLKPTFDRLHNCHHDAALIQLAETCLNPDAAQRPADASRVHECLGDYFCQRDEKLKTAALTNARNEARIASEQKRRKQVTSLLSLIAIIFLVSMVAGGLYLSERTARQQHILKHRLDRESSVRSAIRSALTLDAQTFDSRDVERAKLWNQALVEINSVGTIVESDIAHELRCEYEETKQRIERRLSVASISIKHQRRDDAVRSAIQDAIERSQYPNHKLQFKRDAGIVEDLKTAFEVYGISVESEIDDSAALIRSSKIHTQLVRGLRLWRAYLVRKNSKLRDPVLLNWIEDLTRKVDPDPFRQHVRSIEKSGDRESATAATKDPRALDSLASTHVLIDCLQSLELNEQQTAFLIQAQLFYPHDYKINWQLGQRYRKRPAKDLRSALECFRICLSLQPDNPGVFVDLIGVLYEMEEFQLAIDYSETMSKIAPEYPEAYVMIGICLARMDRLVEGLEYCYKAIEQRPNFPLAQYNRSLMAGELNRTAEELEAINQAIKGRPTAKHFVHRAIIYQKNQMFEKAIKSLQPAIKRHPHDKRILLRLGDLNALTGRLETALDYYLKADKSQPFEPTTVMKLANTLTDLGRPYEAEWWCGSISHQQWSGWKVQCSQIEALGDQGRFGEAIEMYDTLTLSRSPNKLPKRTQQYYQDNLHFLR